MKIQEVLDNKTNSKLDNIKNDVSFEKAYDEGVMKLRSNRRYLKKYKEVQNFLRNRKNSAVGRPTPEGTD